MQKAILQESDYFYQFQNMPENICAVFSNRSLNVGYKNQTEPQLINNRKAVLSGIDEVSLDNIVCAKQVHDNNIYIAEKKDAGRGALSYLDAIDNTDAFITKEKNLCLCIFIADCLPVHAVDKRNNIIALAHCGWKGTKKSILKNTILLMQQNFKSAPEDIAVFFGPSIRSCCYEVGSEFSGHFKSGILQRQDKLFLDLIEINYAQLREVGILESNIFDSGICTSCQNDKFFSYRREGEKCGRQMALMIMR
jgi:YfiH family protein